MENVKLFREDKVVECYSVIGCDSGVVFASGLFKNKAKKIVTCWNEHDSLKTKNKLLVTLLDEILEWDGILDHSKVRIKQTLNKAKNL